MRKIFSLAIPNIAQSKLFIVSVLLNAGGSGLVMAFLLIYFDQTTNIGLAAIGFAITLGRAAAMIAPLLIGRLLDSAGSRNVAIWGDFITGIGFCLCGLAGNMPMIALSQIFVQAGSHMFWTSNRGMVRLAAQGAGTQTWFGLIGALRNAGLGAGTLLSSLVFSYHSPALLHAMILAVAGLYFASSAALFCWRPAGEAAQQAEQEAETGAKNYREVIRDRKYLGLLFLNSGLVVAAMVIPLVIVVFSAQQIGMPAVFSGFLIILNTALVALLGAHISAWTESIPPQRNIRNGYILNIISFFLFWTAVFFAGNIWPAGVVLILAMLIYTAAEMIAMPAVNALSVDLAPEQGSGRYMALFQMTWSVGMTITPALFGWLLSEDRNFTWLALLLLVGVFGALGFKLFGERKRLKPSDKDKNILIIEPIGMGGGLLAEAVKKTGCRVIAATAPDIRKTMLSDIEKFIDDAVYADFSDLPGAAKTLVASDDKYHYAAVLASWEFLTEVAANVAHQLGLRGPDVQKNHARRNKFAMHQAWEAAACPIPALQAVIEPNVSEFAHLSAALEFPAVVKPAENSASFGVSVIYAADELADAVAAARQWLCEFPHGTPFDRKVLIQEYISGQEFSVEAVSDSGRFFAWGVTMKFTTEGKSRAETGHIFPAPIDMALRDKILAVAKQGAAALGITNGISHTEIKLDEKGEPRLIECGPRPAGDYIPKLVTLACGENPAEIYVMQAMRGLAADFSPKKPLSAAAVHFIRPEKEGILRGVKFPDKICGGAVEDYRVTVPPGAAVKPGRTNIERIGWAVLTAPDAASARVAMQDFISHIEVEIA